MRSPLVLPSFLVLSTLAGPAFSQTPGNAASPAAELWSPLGAPVMQAAQSAEAPARGARQVYRLSSAALERRLDPAAKGARVLPIPMPDGSQIAFVFEESPVLDPALAERFPEIRTYAGRDTAQAGHTARFSWTPLGFHAIVLSPDQVVFVQPDQPGDTATYVSYRYEPAAGIPFQCLLKSAEASPDSLLAAPLVASGASRRTYRLAVAATGEYTQFFGGTVPLAMAGIANTVNSVNAIYNRDIAINLVLIADNDDVVYTNPATDPFPLADLNAEVQAELDATIGDADYDVGHLFHAAGFSGNAGCIACVCDSGDKGSGFSQDGSPNDGDFVFLVAHEMGHQHGGRHTWNGTGCSFSQWDNAANREPGSGTTIMSYSSICGSDNVQGSQVGDLYFHADSREKIVNYTTGGGGGTACGVAAATGNAVPTVNGGSDFTIPRGTPFVLTASGNDADAGDQGSLTYVWEQYNLAPARAALNAVDDGDIPLFRSFPPSSSSARTFPRFADLLAGSGSLFPNKLGEQLPGVDRDPMTFRVTVRDNRPSVGAAEDDEVRLTVTGDPFVVDAPSGGNPLECAVSDTVQWTVGGGSVAPTVDIRLSTNGGASFPTLLAGGTANDGSEAVNVPATLSNNARVRIDSIGNVFFNISGPTAIVDTLDPTPTCPPDVSVECVASGGTPKTDPSLAAFFAGFSATDFCDATPTLTNNAPDLFPVGTTPVTFTATDDSANADSCAANVTVEDTVPPTIAVTVSPTVLWPPNHKMVTITANVVVDDVCDPNVAFQLVSITSDEPDNGQGDGNTTDDIQGAAFGTPDLTFQLRAERQGNGDGRVYTIVYRALDMSGNTTDAIAQVVVPKSQGN